MYPLLRKSITQVIFIICLSIATAHPLTSEELTDAIEIYGEWSVFKDEQACWIASDAAVVNGIENNHADEQAVAFLAFHYGSMEPEITFALGNINLDNTTLKVSDRSYVLFNDGEILYTKYEDLDLLRTMLGANELSISGNNQSRVFYLKGFKQAYNHVARICNFHRLKPNDQDRNLRRG